MLLDAVHVVPGEAVDVEVDADHDDARDEEGDERRYHRVRRTEVEGAHVLGGDRRRAVVEGGLAAVAPSYSAAAASAVPVERNGQEGDEGGREPNHGDRDRNGPTMQCRFEEVGWGLQLPNHSSKTWVRGPWQRRQALTPYGWNRLVSYKNPIQVRV